MGRVQVQTEEDTEAWAEGYDAFAHGWSSEDNPYPGDTVDAADWHDGWVIARRDAEGGPF